MVHFFNAEEKKVQIFYIGWILFCYFPTSPSDFPPCQKIFRAKSYTGVKPFFEEFLWIFLFVFSLKKKNLLGFFLIILRIDRTFLIYE